MKVKFTEKFPLITGLRGNNGSFMEDGFGAAEMNCRGQSVFENCFLTDGENELSNTL